MSEIKGEKEYVGGDIFDKIQVDPRVTKDLTDCIYCVVVSHNPDASLTDLKYKIPLNCINTIFKQCPACKRIYILQDDLTP